MFNLQKGKQLSPWAGNQKSHHFPIIFHLETGQLDKGIYVRMIDFLKWLISFVQLVSVSWYCTGENWVLEKNKMQGKVAWQVNLSGIPSRRWPWLNDHRKYGYTVCWQTGSIWCKGLPVWWEKNIQCHTCDWSGWIAVHNRWWHGDEMMNFYDWYTFTKARQYELKSLQDKSICLFSPEEKQFTIYLCTISASMQIAPAFSDKEL